VSGQRTSEPVVPDYDEVWNEVYGDLQDRGPAHRHMRRIYRRLLGDLDYSSALDVGCGAGHNLPLISEGHSMDRIAGADLSKVALAAAAKRHPEAEFFELDIEQDSAPDQWELVFSAFVLEHLPADTDALRNMRAMTARHLVVSTVAGDFERYRPWDEQMGHVRNYAVGELERKVTEAGFRVQRTIYWGFPFYTPVARTLQNRMTSEPSFGLGARIASSTMYLLYWLNSHRRGDLVVLHATAD